MKKKSESEHRDSQIQGSTNDQWFVARMLIAETENEMEPVIRLELTT